MTRAGHCQWHAAVLNNLNKRNLRPSNRRFICTGKFEFMFSAQPKIYFINFGRELINQFKRIYLSLNNFYFSDSRQNRYGGRPNLKNRAAITLVLALIKILIVAFSLYDTSHILIKNMIYYYSLVYKSSFESMLYGNNRQRKNKSQTFHNQNRGLKRK